MRQYNPAIHHRRSIRLQNYDYSQLGAYFVTICTEGRIETFGEIVEGVMHLNNRGEVVANMWNTLPKRFPGIELDHFIIMPNHFHGIIVRTQQNTHRIDDNKNEAHFVAASPTKGVLFTYRTDPKRSQKLNEMMRTFKSLVSYHIHKNGRPEFTWQREYYEHIIRNEQQLNLIRAYIINNPLTWHKDTLRPQT